MKIARIMELNDPFEFLVANIQNREFRRAMNETKRTLSKSKGLICFSKTWKDPVQWSHYSDHHRGICLGFEIPVKNLAKVDYVSERIKHGGKVGMDEMRRFLTTKFEHWSYEEEYRCFVALDPDEEEDGLYFTHFSSELQLKTVIVGHSSEVSRADVSEALGDLSGVKAFKARAAFSRFEVIRNENERRWT